MVYPSVSVGRLQSASRKTQRAEAITFYAMPKKKIPYNKAGIQRSSQAASLPPSGLSASGEEVNTKEMNHIPNANLCMSKPRNYVVIGKQALFRMPSGTK